MNENMNRDNLRVS